MSTETEPRLRLEQYLGLQIKRQRQAQSLKLADVARIAGISQGMLSKIENAQVSTSLDTLSRLCDVLGMPMAKLFSQYDQPDGNALLVKAGEGLEVVRRGTEKGHTYTCSITPGAEEELRGLYGEHGRRQRRVPHLRPPRHRVPPLAGGRTGVSPWQPALPHARRRQSDFDGETPHGPEQLVQVPIRLLSIMNYGDE